MSLVTLLYRVDIWTLGAGSRLRQPGRACIGITYIVWSFFSPTLWQEWMGAVVGTRWWWASIPHSELKHWRRGRFCNRWEINVFYMTFFSIWRLIIQTSWSVCVSSTTRKLKNLLARSWKDRGESNNWWQKGELVSYLFHVKNRSLINSVYFGKCPKETEKGLEGAS